MSIDRLQNLLADYQFKRRDIEIDPSAVYELVFAGLGWSKGRIAAAIADTVTPLEAQLLSAVHSGEYAVELVRNAIIRVMGRLDAAEPEDC